MKVNWPINSVTDWLDEHEWRVIEKNEESWKKKRRIDKAQSKQRSKKKRKEKKNIRKKLAKKRSLFVDKTSFSFLSLVAKIDVFCKKKMVTFFLLKAETLNIMQNLQLTLYLSSVINVFFPSDLKSSSFLTFFPFCCIFFVNFFSSFFFRLDGFNANRLNMFSWEAMK